jgi:hypothetical protein
MIYNLYVLSSFMSSSPNLSTGSVDLIYNQRVIGARRPSNFLFAITVSIGGIGFVLASLSSRLGRDVLPILHVHAPQLVWNPQGLVMGLYGIAAIFLSIYLWTVIFVDLGSGINCFDKAKGIATITRNGLRTLIQIEIPLKEIYAVRLDIREGLNPLRRLSLRSHGRRDLPLTSVSQPQELAELEQSGASLARFLGVPLEGL